MSPLISVIIPTFNRPAELTRCLKALAASAMPQESFEVIVVDDGGSQALAALPAISNLRVERQENAGPASARNRGASVARGELLAFTDDDCLPQPGWLSAFWEASQLHPGHALAGDTINALGGNVFSEASQQLIAYLYEYLEAHQRPGTEWNLAPFFTSNNMAVPRARFEETGGFSEIFERAAAEDREFSFRWSRFGFQMTYAPKAVIHHAHDLDLASFLRQHSNYGRGALCFHEVRVKQLGSRLRREPMSFYWSLMRYPLRNGWNGRSLRIAALMGLSQAATVAGVVSQLFRQR